MCLIISAKQGQWFIDSSLKKSIFLFRCSQNLDLVLYNSGGESSPIKFFRIKRYHALIVPIKSFHLLIGMKRGYINLSFRISVRTG
jgi:hypothetical protein